MAFVHLRTTLFAAARSRGRYGEEGGGGGDTPSSDMEHTHEAFRDTPSSLQKPKLPRSLRAGVERLNVVFFDFIAVTRESEV